VRAASIRARVHTYASSGAGDVRKLSGRSREYRLRVGDWRVVFSLGVDPETEEPAIVVLSIADRRDVYRS
jgi:mRNA interferase RelE/StbE